MFFNEIRPLLLIKKALISPDVQIPPIKIKPGSEYVDTWPL